VPEGDQVQRTKMKLIRSPGGQVKCLSSVGLSALPQSQASRFILHRSTLIAHYRRSRVSLAAGAADRLTFARAHDEDQDDGCLKFEGAGSAIPCHARSLSTPLHVEVHAADNWDAAH